MCYIMLLYCALRVLIQQWCVRCIMSNCAVRPYYAGITWTKEIDFVMNHTKVQNGSVNLVHHCAMAIPAEMKFISYKSIKHCAAMLALLSMPLSILQMHNYVWYNRNIKCEQFNIHQ